MTATAPEAQRSIEQCQGMVRSLALSIHRKLPPRYDLDDLIAYGQVGLAEAAKDFDPERGSQFSTYAYYRIRGAIYDGLSKMSWFGRSQQNLIRYEQRANDVCQAATEENAKAPPPSLEADARWFRDISRTLAVVYLASHGMGGAESRENEVVDPASLPSQEVFNEETVSRLQSQIDALPTEEAKFIRALYFEGQTLQQAGEQLGISKSWASRLHHKILQRLGRSLKSAGVES